MDLVFPSDVPLVEFMYLVFPVVGVPLVELMDLVLSFEEVPLVEFI